MLALETCAKGSGSMRLTFLLAYRVHFCCLLRPQSPSILFPPSIPCSPFAQSAPVSQEEIAAQPKPITHLRRPLTIYCLVCTGILKAQKGLEMYCSNELLLGRYL